MATFIKEPSGRWRVRVRIKGSAPISQTFRTRAIAEAWAREKEDEIEGGDLVDNDADKLTVSDLLDKYQREVTEHKKGKAQENSKLAILDADLGQLTLRQLTAEAVAKFVHGRMHPGEGLRPIKSDTVRRELATLSAVLETARVLWGYRMPDNPAKTTAAVLSKSRTLKRKVRRDRRLRPGEYRRLLTAISPPLRPLIRLAIETAMRRGELAKLKPAHLRHDGLLIEDDKTGKTTIIPISSKARRIIERLPAEGFGIRPDSITQAFDRACARADIEDLRFHDLRHEGTSRLFEKGLGIEEVASITRHADWRSLKGYTHPARARTAAKLG